jgi:hypothetical protein
MLECPRTPELRGTAATWTRAHLTLGTKAMEGLRRIRAQGTRVLRMRGPVWMRAAPGEAPAGADATPAARRRYSWRWWRPPGAVGDGEHNDDRGEPGRADSLQA